MSDAPTPPTSNTPPPPVPPRPILPPVGVSTPKPVGAPPPSLPRLTRPVVPSPGGLGPIAPPLSGTAPAPTPPATTSPALAPTARPPLRIPPASASTPPASTPPPPAEAPVAPKPKLRLSTADQAPATSIAAVAPIIQKTAQPDRGPGAAVVALAGLSAAASIAFAVLLYLIYALPL